MGEIEVAPTRAYHKDTPETREKILGFLRMGATRKDAAEAAGISRETLYQWMKDDPYFSDTVREAEGTVAAEMAACIAKAARKDWRASLEWLKRRRREDWGDNIRLDVSQLSNEQLVALLAEETGGGGDSPRAEDTAEDD